MHPIDVRDVVAWRLAHRLRLRIDLFLLSPDFRRHYGSSAVLSDVAAIGPRRIADGFARVSPLLYASDVRVAKAAQQRVLDLMADAYGQKLIAHDEYLLVEELGKRAVRAAGRLISSLESTRAGRPQVRAKGRIQPRKRRDPRDSD